MERQTSGAHRFGRVLPRILPSFQNRLILPLSLAVSLLATGQLPTYASTTLSSDPNAPKATGGCQESYSELLLPGLKRFVPPHWSDPDSIFDDLVKAKAFQDFLKQRKVRPETLDPKGKEAMVREFRASYFGRLAEPKQLQKERDASLHESLRLHGWKGNAKSARDGLEDLSSANARKIIQDHPLARLSKHDDEIRALIDRLEPAFVHNTPTAVRSYDPVIVSSRRLQAFGLDGGLNTLPFNSEIMKTDDNVYFKVVFKNKDRVRIAGYDDFTGETIVLNSDYARMNGWISHYVMVPEELMDFGVIIEPKKYAPLVDLWKRLGLFEGMIHADRIPEHYVSELAAVRDQLHRSDFTVPDYERVFRHGLRLALNAIAESNPERYKEVTRLIRTGIRSYTPEEREKRINWIRLMQKIKRFSAEQAQAKIDSLDQPDDLYVAHTIGGLLREALGISSNYELKVPVAVHTDAYKLDAQPGKGP